MENMVHVMWDVLKKGANVHIFCSGQQLGLWYKLLRKATKAVEDSGDEDNAEPAPRTAPVLEVEKAPGH